KLAKAFLPLAKMQMGADAQAKQAIDNAEKTLNSIAIDQKGSGVHVGLKTELNPAILAGALLPAMQKVRGAAQKVEASNNLKQIALAMHIYHDTHGHFPPAVIYSKDGKTPLYSWRVELLPYLEQQALYNEFKKDEPWNGPNNVKLIQKMPQVYALPGQKNTSMTNYKVFVTKSPKGAPPPNNGAPFGDDRKVKMTDITDGTSNTIMIAESAMMVQWT